MTTEVIASRSLLSITKEFYAEYGRHTIENRALADIRDGLKPVDRRVLWAAGPLFGNLNLVPGGAFKKAARLVGDTMGKYHPHGDSSIYGSMVTMAAKIPVPLLKGQGNWGGPTDGPAAMRYTECRMTKYGWDCMFTPAYLATVRDKLIPNYDGTEQEPYYLPARLPNLLLNGSYGIATGVTGVVPPVTLESLIPFIERAMEGKTITTERLKKNIKFNLLYGGVNASSDEQMMNFLEEGCGSLRFEARGTVDHDTRTIYVTEVPPMCNWDSVVKRLGSVKMAKIVADYADMVDKKERLKKGNRAIKFMVKLKTSVSRDDIKAATQQVLDCFITMTYSSAMRWTHRIDGSKVNLQSGTLANLISLWTEYRVQLEVDAQIGIIAELDKSLMRQRVLKLAAENVEIIAKIIKQSLNPIGDLVKKFKITEEEANIILDLTLRRLTRLSREKIEQDIANLHKDRKVAVQHKNNPGPKVISDINSAIALTTVTMPKV